MAKETAKPKNPFSTKRWERLEALPPTVGVNLQEKEYTPYCGTIKGKRGYHLIVLSDGNFYACSISKENLYDFKKLKERLGELHLKFLPNESVNPFTDTVWKEFDLEVNLTSYEGKVFRDCIMGSFGGHSYKMSTTCRQFGHEVDWIETLGVVMHW